MSTYVCFTPKSRTKTDIMISTVVPTTEVVIGRKGRSTAALSISFYFVCSARDGVRLPLPAPAQQGQATEAGGQYRESARDWSRAYFKLASRQCESGFEARFPPGRLGLLTSPAFSGSSALLKTIGIVAVAHRSHAGSAKPWEPQQHPHLWHSRVPVQEPSTVLQADIRAY
jgi:hypothetical protein